MVPGAQVSRGSEELQKPPKAGPHQDGFKARFTSADLCSPKGHGIFNYHFLAKVTVFFKNVNVLDINNGLTGTGELGGEDSFVLHMYNFPVKR